MAFSLKTALASTFLASASHDPKFNRVEGYDDILNGGSRSLIDFANTSLFPGQSSSFAGVVNGVKNKGGNTPAGGGGTSLALANGGMFFAAGTAGFAGLKIGASATAAVAHVNDLTGLAAGEQPLFVTTFRIDAAAADNNQRVIAALGDSGSNPGGKLQWALTYNQNGLTLYVAGQSTVIGFVPVVGKVYVVGTYLQPNAATGLTTALIWVYNATDGVPVIDGASVVLSYVAWSAMVNGGMMIGNPSGLTGFVSPTSLRVYRHYLEGVFTTSISPRDPAEQFGAEARKIRGEVLAGTIA